MRFYLAVLMLLATTLSVAAPIEIRGVWIQELPFGTQLIFNTSGAARHSSFLLDNPPRLVVDLSGASFRASLRGALRSPDVNGVRIASRSATDLRIVVDLPVLVHSETYMLKTAEESPRLMVDLYRNQRPDPASIRPNTGDPAPVVRSSRPVGGPTAAEVPAAAQPPKLTPVKPAPRKLVIAIDPGHGGKDTGAIGPSGTREKDIVMQIARRLQRLVNKEPGMRAVLTRNDDSYLRLYERIDIARRQKADLFISVHADACEDCQASGSSVFILSTKGASSAAARWLAKRENESDLIGGGKLGNMDEALVPVVFDMVHDAVLADSMRLADRVLDKLNRVGQVHKDYVERAGFAVLKAPDMPSILVETAFISNRREEIKLAQPDHQEKIAQAILDGIRAFAHQRPPQELLVAEAPEAAQSVKKTAAAKPVAVAAVIPSPRPPRPLPQVYVIQRGESLEDVAARYRVSLSSLRSVNGLGDNQLRVPAGTSLVIPGSDSQASLSRM